MTPAPLPGPAPALSPDPADPASPWSRRCLLGLHGLSAAEIRTLLTTARSLAELSTRSVKKVPTLRGRVVANLFFEDSTRTRLSFTLAAQRLGADVIDLTEVGSSVNKGETVADTALNVEAMGVDAMVVRHRAAGAAELVARAVDCAVINAGDGRHEHPTQGLLDAYTLAESHGRLESFDLSGLRVAIVGDIVSSRVARSDIAGLTKLGASVVCIGPPTLAPRSLEALGCEVSHTLEAAYGCDAVNMLRIQFERHAGETARAAPAGPPSGPSSAPPSARSTPAFPSLREYAAEYALTAERADRLKPGCVVMHPGPMNRGVEIADCVADGPRSVILRQVTNGLAIRMAALVLCVSSGEALERRAAGSRPAL